MSETGEAHPEQLASAALPFVPAEWTEFHKEDVHTGTAVVGLLTVIFIFGLLLYLAVLYYVMAAPQIG